MGRIVTKKTAEKYPVIVTVDNSSNLIPTVELAVSIAVDHNSALHGLFIEDRDLLQVAQLPFSTEVSLIGGRPRNFDHQQLRRYTESCISQFENILARQADVFSISWSFSRIQGRKELSELSRSVDAEFMIIGQNGQWLTVGRQRIVLLCHHSNRLLPALRSALNKTPDRAVDLCVVVPEQQTTADCYPGLNSLVADYPGVELAITPLQSLIKLLARSPRTVNLIIASRHDKNLHSVLSLAHCPAIIVE